MSELRKIYAEHKNVRYVRLYREGRKAGMYNRKTLAIDRPVNQLSQKELGYIVYNIRYTLSPTGDVVLQAVYFA